MLVKKLLGSIGLLLIVSACSDFSNDKENDFEVEKSEPDVEKVDVVALPSTTEEWLSLAEQSSWYLEEKQGYEFQDGAVIDFDGDTIPEVVKVYRKDPGGRDFEFTYTVGKFDPASREWIDWKSNDIESGLVSIREIGTMQLDSGEELLVLNGLLPGGSSVNDMIILYRYSVADDEIILSARIVADFNTTRVDENTLYYSNSSSDYAYRQEGNWLVSGAARIYLRSVESFYEEPFIHIIGNHKIKEAQVWFDNYEETIDRLGTPSVEDDYNGGICASYNDFFFCNDTVTPEISSIFILLEKNLTIEDIKKVLGEPHDGGLIEMDGNYFVWDYYMGEYNIQFASETGDPGSRIVEMVIVQSGA